MLKTGTVRVQTIANVHLYTSARLAILCATSEGV